MAEINGGYILTSRKLINSSIMKKPPNYLKVWIYLLSKASFQKHGNLERGQGFCSIPELIEVCTHYAGARPIRATKKEIWGILEWLRNPHEGNNGGNTKVTMIETTKVTHGFIYTVVKYNYYQDPNNYEGNNEGNNEKPAKEQRKGQQGNNINKNGLKNEKNEKKYKDIYDYYLSLDLKKHRAYTPAMAKAIEKAIKENKYSEEDCKELLKKHEHLVKSTKKSDYPVRARPLHEFFGQKVYNGTHLICTEYEPGGKYGDIEIKEKKPKKEMKIRYING